MTLYQDDAIPFLDCRVCDLIIHKRTVMENELKEQPSRKSDLMVVL
jgi:hypothetical protein